MNCDTGWHATTWDSSICLRCGKDLDDSDDNMMKTSTPNDW
ncbi:hypothetical protein SEA_CHEWYVIII_6 [Rhodococcus phage ChewyVIII]|uniref:Uncharacterized protein n=1 Tax=Rhodococcus phage ChewyVIII TaxID=1887657 RepID=A0A1C9EI08_9CAUD|nr:hypothetical protein QEH30_gp06 [Rhodococcus phage ChewyVIII]AON97429.1 hypothetical protein SEA_CHEWYVIII_6 [Rhodococcus phage ChewyVIII]